MSEGEKEWRNVYSCSSFSDRRRTVERDDDDDGNSGCLQSRRLFSPFFCLAFGVLSVLLHYAQKTHAHKYIDSPTA